MRNKEEEKLQIACIKWFDYQYPEYSKLLFAVPNGGSRNKIEAANLKKQGVRAGVSDIVFLKENNKYDFLCIEFKTEKGKQTDNQIIFQEDIKKHTSGYYIIIRSFEQFKKSIEQYLKI